MYPSCSEYALDALERHGPVMGWIMATDRLMRCGRDVKERAGRVFIDGKWKYFDPVDANDFWWAEKGKEDRNSIDSEQPGY